MKLTLALLIFGTAAFGADPRLMNLVMPDAKVLAGMNVTSAKNSPLGQFLMSRVPMMAELQDVTEILAASTGKGGLVLADGNFDPAKFTGLKDAVISTYAGATLITLPKISIALIGTTIAVAGDAPSVTAALDRSSGTNAIDPALAAQVSALSVAQDAWVAGSALPTDMLPAQAAQFLASIQSYSGGVKFGQSVPVTLDIVADSPQDAEALGNVVKLLLSMVPQSDSLLKSLQVNTSGSTLDLAMTIPEAQIEALIPAH